MSMEKRSNSDRRVARVFIVYWLLFGVVIGSTGVDADFFGALVGCLLLCVSVTFLIAYFFKERIRLSPWKYVSLFALLVALMFVPCLIIIGDCFGPYLSSCLMYIVVTFSYTYLLKSRISSRPWLYLFPIFILYLTILLALPIVLF